MTFKDHFSSRAALYATYRPHYPDALFDFIAGLTKEHRAALDCGTGNGQAAIGLAGRFERVFATDPSAEQIQIDPVIEVEKSLARDWGDPESQRLIHWPAYMRAGLISAPLGEDAPGS